MTDSGYRMKTVHFPEANATDERLTAVLVTQSQDGTVKAYVKDFDPHNPPDYETVAALVESAATNNEEN
jgi:hypothetical protein